MPESDDKFDVINDVDIVCLRIQQAGIPFNAELDKWICTHMGAHESLEVRKKNGNPD